MQRILGCLALAGIAFGQGLDNRSLTGRYYVRQTSLVNPPAAGVFTDTRSLAGSITFDGNGAFVFSGQQLLGNAAAAAVNGNGTYSVKSNGFVTMTNLLRAGESMNARMGDGVLAASTTDSASGVFDLLVAVAAPAGGVTSAALNGEWWVASLEMTGGSALLARNAYFKLTAANGNFGATIVSGQAANLGRRPVAQTVTGAGYALTGDGSGTATFPLPAGTTAAQSLVSGLKNLYVSRDGNFLMMGSVTAGVHDVLIGVRAMTGAVTNVSLKDLFYGAGLRVDGQTPNSFTGTTNSTGTGIALLSRRFRAPEGNADFSGVNRYTLRADGTGTAELGTLILGAGGNAFLGSGVSLTDSNNYEIYFGFRVPAVAQAAGVFLHPYGVVNSASFAPVGNPVSPQQFFSAFGNGLAAATQTASALPFPKILAGVELLMNGVAAPVYFVSPALVIGMVPQATAPGTATLVVNNNGTRSNTVEVTVARTAPGIFTVPPAGVGPGAVLKTNFTLVSPANPARRGETVLVYLTGLGAVSPAVPDGAAASSNPLSLVTGTVNVYIGGVPAQVTFKGLAPGLAGLYQLNVVIPAGAPGGSVPLAIETAEAFHDQVDIAIVP